MYDLKRIANYEIDFVCTACGECCRNFSDDRGVIVIKDDIVRIAKAMILSESEFIKHYCNIVNKYINNLEIKIATLKYKGGACLFLKNDKCVIHIIKPLQCLLSPLGLFWNAKRDFECLNGINIPSTFSSDDADDRMLENIILTSDYLKNLGF